MGTSRGATNWTLIIAIVCLAVGIAIGRYLLPAVEEFHDGEDSSQWCCVTCNISGVGPKEARDILEEIHTALDADLAAGHINAATHNGVAVLIAKCAVNMKKPFGTGPDPQHCAKLWSARTHAVKLFTANPTKWSQCAADLSHGH